MTTQPEALRLADAIDPRNEDDLYWRDREAAAAELRRLYNLLMDQQGEIYALKFARLMEQKTAALKQAALLEALQKAVKLNSFREFNDHIPAMKAAIAAAEAK